MKQSMQVVATVAFLGCFAILVIAAGAKKAKSQEHCGEEWKKALQQEEKKPATTGAAAHTGCVAFPGPLFHAII